MPIYEYSCEKCGKKIDVLQKMDEPAPARCESCGELGTMARQVSRTSFVLKGGGWYSDLYGSSKKDSTATTPAPASAPASGATPAVAKPAETSTTKKDSGGSSGSGGSTPPASGGTSSSGGGGGGTSGSSASPA